MHLRATHKLGVSDRIDQVRNHEVSTWSLLRSTMGIRVLCFLSWLGGAAGCTARQGRIGGAGVLTETRTQGGAQCDDMREGCHDSAH